MSYPMEQSFGATGVAAAASSHAGDALGVDDGMLEGGRCWSYLTANARIVRCPGGHVSERRFERPVILAILESVGGPMRVELGHAERTVFSSDAPHLSLIPAGTGVRLEAAQTSMFRELVIEIIRDPFSAMAHQTPEMERGVQAPMMIADSDVLRIAELMSAECLSSQPCDPIFGESLSVVLLKMLSRMPSVGGDAPSRGGLPPWQLRRVTQFLEDNLVRGVRLVDLADLVSLSPSYLIRAFKRSTGMTPQQWLRNARIRKAQTFLVERTLSLASVAQETGFADQAHLTRIFGQITGESPGAWRRARLTSSEGTRSVPLVGTDVRLTAMSG